MQKKAQAVLTDEYEALDNSKPGNGLYSPGGNSAPVPKKMRSIQVLSMRGKPLMVLQSEDNKIAIEQTLKINGWQIVAWDEDHLQLVAITAQTPANGSVGSVSPSVGHGVQQTVVVNNNVAQNNNNNSSSSCLGCLGVVVLFILVCFVIGGAISATSGY